MFDEGVRVSTEREKLKKLEEEIEKLLRFIWAMESENLPDFYRYFDTMKNNIQIFNRVGGRDFEEIHRILRRDWKAAHMVLIGIQYYNPADSHPDLDRKLIIYYASVLSYLNRYFA